MDDGGFPTGISLFTYSALVLPQIRTTRPGSIVYEPYCRTRYVGYRYGDCRDRNAQKHLPAGGETVQYHSCTGPVPRLRHCKG